MMQQKWKGFKEKMSEDTEKPVFPVLLSENLWMLGNYFFNIYLVRGNNSSALIEVGISAITDSVIRQLESLNIAPTYIVVTHPHSDHLTGLEGLRQRYPGAVTIFGHGSKEFATHPMAMSAMVKEDLYMAKMLAARGIEPGRPPVQSFQFPDNHIIVKEKYEIDLGDLVLHFKKVNGHSPGNIAVYIKEKGALIVSDSLGFHFPGRCFLPLFFTGYSEYLETLDSFQELEWTILCPAHQGALTGAEAKQAFHASREAALNLHSDIIKARKNRDEISDDIFNTYYKDEFTLYSRENIKNCTGLLVRRAFEASANKTQDLTEVI
jgi:glyoxylase-like metal-dependent hydrolase (beta-lactamase superfamily II)